MNNIVFGNLAFNLVNTAVQLNKRQMRFIGMIKTATKRFPMELLQETILSSCGQYTELSTYFDNAKLMKYVCLDQDWQFFIAIAVSIIQGQPYQHICWTGIGDKKGKRLAEHLVIAVPMPHALEI